MPDGNKTIPLSICIVSHAAQPQFGVMVTQGRQSELRRNLAGIVAKLDDSPGVDNWDGYDEAIEQMRHK